MKLKNWHLFTGLVFAVAFMLWLIIQPDFSSTFEERATEVLAETWPDATIRFESSDNVYKWEEHKKPYIDALELYYEAAVYDLIPMMTYEKVYQELNKAKPGGTDRYLFHKDFFWVEAEHDRLLVMAIDDTVYVSYMKARKQVLQDKLSKHNKTPRCLLLEAETLTEKIKNHELDDQLYVNHEVTITIPVTKDVYFVKKLWLHEYDYPKKLKDKEFWYLKDKFLALTFELQEFMQKVDC